MLLIDQTTSLHSEVIIFQQKARIRALLACTASAGTFNIHCVQLITLILFFRDVEIVNRLQLD
uniref:Uncharacterized protein n=1 Tax=Pristionchus pacificus TaxID=54126 RepID=A0A2A6C5Z1_PRIPA|eukprot:PDM73508.1 hypothetical protein PRIPAC_40864 [Pristionchus pacificus]